MSDGEVIESWSLFSWNWEIKANLSLEKAGLVSHIQNKTFFLKKNNYGYND